MTTSSSIITHPRSQLPAIDDPDIYIPPHISASDDELGLPPLPPFM
ncbi:MAG: hypothetical protein HZC38_02040, partial [Chloroflexi bacterium]|nr:hypothetical protein [Chloroflexota bacterium]